jgi:hypothetical protein
MRRAIALTLVILLTAGCSQLRAVASLAGGGPGINANVQAGQVNSQTLGTTRNTRQSVGDVSGGRLEQNAEAPRLRAETVERVVINELSPAMLVALILAILFPSPGEIGRRILNFFRQ